MTVHCSTGPRQIFDRVIAESSCASQLKAAALSRPNERTIHESTFCSSTSRWVRCHLRYCRCHAAGRAGIGRECGRHPGRRRLRPRLPSRPSGPLHRKRGRPRGRCSPARASLPLLGSGTPCLPHLVVRTLSAECKTPPSRRGFCLAGPRSALVGAANEFPHFTFDANCRLHRRISTTPAMRRITPVARDRSIGRCSSPSQPK